MDDCVHHEINVLLLHRGHQSEVQQSNLSFGGIGHFQEISRVRVAVEEPDLQELGQEALLADPDQGLNLIRIALGELDAVHPFADEQLARGVLLVHVWDVHIGNSLFLKKLLQPHLILALVREVQLRVESDRPFVQEGDVVRFLLRSETVDEALVYLSRTPEDVEILGYRLRNARPLHLDGDVLIGTRQSCAVHLSKRRCGHWLLRNLVEDRA
mmetsp:Transcript_20469/g.41257  ORF Transcript_20469/g.41257 Transcript_20469/m.41257 type:complete len:213 (-) Transcript_20469:859-1497(-)